MKIPTSEGLIERSDLKVLFDIAENETAFNVTCKWMYEDKLVRQDVWVNLKHGLNALAEQGTVGG